MENKITIGTLENFDLPELGILGIQARIDTGAKTSSLHVDNLSRFTNGGKPWVKYDIHPNIHSVDEIIHCQSPIKDIRKVKSSNGDSEERYLIRTLVKVGDAEWPIEITLTNRQDMSNLMLFGREGMGDRVLIDPSSTFLLES
ncbi:MAG: ATP-dependent zinc protease [Piscirickettsiaceae bacterium]|jgi:hypothetical protein|nr:ATP-dependent zinc protease [Piscirickettsiaceae bacterium]